MDMASDISNEDCTNSGQEGLSAVVPDRLLKRDQERQQAAERRREEKAGQTVKEEKGGFFSSTFDSEKAEIQDLLSGCSELDREEAARVLDEATLRIQQLQKALNDSVVFLPVYDLRRAQASLQALQGSLAEKRDQILPKKKFAFRSRATNKPKTTTNEVSTDISPNSGLERAEEMIENSGLSVDGTCTAGQCGLSNADAQVLTMGAEEVRQRDVLLTHLSNCKVRILGSPSTLHIKHVRNCEILCGPVSSSIFLDHVSGCTFAFACQQLRTHNTTDSQIYLHVTSRAIIEDCRDVRFAPFNWSYPGIDADYQVAGLDCDRNNWALVDDFNWLASNTPSPNWTVIPESERRSNWDSVEASGSE